MPHRIATLYIRITTKDGRNSYCKPVYLSKGRLKPHFAMVNRKPEHHSEGVYYVRVGTDGGKQRFESVGKDAYVAMDKLAEKERWLRDRERGVPYSASDSPKPEGSRLSVNAAVEQYFKNLQSQGKDRKTIRAYKLATEEFRQSCTKKFIDEIRKQDLIDFMGWLRTRPPKLRKDGQPRKPRRSGDLNRTYFNKVNDIVIFLSAQTRRWLSLCDRFLQRRDRQPRYQRSGQFPAHHFARVGIENHGEVDKLTTQSDVGDVGHPKLIDPGQLHSASQIQVNLQLVLRIRGDHEGTRLHRN